ncbi:tRNA (adenosine(37)-N6)-threonylcarbamoyltransferase complex ATPase subunit type 1 TsaE [Polluticoccus soli]|uniref:tRNA (adenosine(37)-N6)-threonylcarbamoyltransferase complex ATPase subunit type 1 TsaE n=1 Tax=Polluticoccus soli TaxID=3034150 RepID=UPI0023E31FFB|nr:tRNA (adenosine(37)-N6)-threonylcarbamoyltransferase complex ATPase subunit type 1 TsaE [Flavipsychrobacter sp. JY13-12]
MPTASLQISYSLANIENAVHQFWQYANQYRILAFSGEMGAGKTTFIHHLCDHLKVRDAVSSPTFALINEYHFDDNGTDRVIYHMDWYRLKDDDEAINAGLEDCLLQKDSYSFVEWPEKAINLLPKPYLWLSIEVITPEERTMTIELRA